MQRSDSVIALILADLLLAVAISFVPEVDGEVRVLLAVCCLILNVQCYREWAKDRELSGKGGFRALVQMAGIMICIIAAFLAVDMIVWRANILTRSGWEKLLHSGGAGFWLTAIVGACGMFFVWASFLRILVSRIRLKMTS